MTFNGEILNYQQLRQEIDYDYITDGDAEVLLALLCTKGLNDLHRLRGQFAFALWDSQKREISLAVDFFGILPLYFSWNKNLLTFSSNAKSISIDGPNKNELALQRYLTDRFLKAPETCYSDLQRIPPAQVWTFGKDSLSTRNWLKFPYPANRVEPSKAKLLSLIGQAADRVVTADVQIGIFLSGGIDSALVAKLVQERVSYTPKSYTAVWQSTNNFNESISAQNTAAAIGLDHHEVVIGPYDWWDAISSGSKFRDAPMSEPADAAFYLLAKKASQELKVVTTGEGADELFCGYPKYKAERFLQNAALRKILEISADFLPNVFDDKKQRLFAALSCTSRAERFQRYFGTYWEDSEIRMEIGVSDSENLNSLDALRDWDLRHYLPNVLLDRADRMCMANSIESRPFFLDLDLAEYALSIEAKHHSSFFSTKRILVEAAETILPKVIRHSKKRGFPIPYSDWFRNELFEKMSSLVLEFQEEYPTLVPRANLIKIIHEHKMKVRNHSQKLYNLVSVAKWLD